MAGPFLSETSPTEMRVTVLSRENTAEGSGRQPRTHVKPVGTLLDHPGALSGELAKVRGKNGGRDDAVEGEGCERARLAILLMATLIGGRVSELTW